MKDPVNQDSSVPNRVSQERVVVCLSSLVHVVRVAEAIPEESRHGVGAARLQLCALRFFIEWFLGE